MAGRFTIDQTFLEREKESQRLRVEGYRGILNLSSSRVASVNNVSPDSCSYDDGNYELRRKK
jgi:hypothetical protein